MSETEDDAWWRKQTADRKAQIRRWLDKPEATSSVPGQLELIEIRKEG